MDVHGDVKERRARRAGMAAALTLCTPVLAWSQVTGSTTVAVPPAPPPAVDDAAAAPAVETAPEPEAPSPAPPDPAAPAAPPAVTDDATLTEPETDPEAVAAATAPSPVAASPAPPAEPVPVPAAPPPSPATTAPNPAPQPYAAEAYYEARLRDSFAAAQGMKGPLEGGWGLAAADGEQLYELQLIDAGDGYVDGAWRDVRRTGALDASGFLTWGQRVGGQFTLRFYPAAGRTAEAVLTSDARGGWSGDLIDGAVRRTVRLTRR